MKGWLITVITFFMLLPSCSDNMKYSIEGKIDNLENPNIYVVFESESRNLVDTIICDKPGRFKIEHKEEGFHQATFFFDERTSWFTIYLDSQAQNIKIAGDIKYPELLQVKGGRINNELASFRKKTEALIKEGIEIRRNINDSPPSERNELTSRLANVKIQLSEQAMTYIHENPEKASSVVLMKTYFANPDDTHILDELLIMLDPDLKDFYLVKDLEQYSVRAKRTALGAEAPDFTVKNIYGDTVSLNKYTSKYVLLTFTAPWCDMCRTDDLYLDEINKLYKKNKLEQLLITLDDDIKGVKDILKKDSIHWNLVADSAGQATMLLNLYNVSSLPRCFLIDEDGKIILKTESGIEIKQTLERIIK